MSSIHQAILAASCLVVACAAIGGCDGVPQAAAPIDVLRVLGEGGDKPGQFIYPRAVERARVGGRDTLVVVDKSARIQVLDPRTGAMLAGWRTPEWELGKPVGLAVAAHPTDPSREALWVADTHYHRVLVYELPPPDAGWLASHEPILSFGRYGTAAGEFVYPTDVAVVAGDAGVERVYVGEYGGNDRVTVFEPGGDGLVATSTFGAFGSGPQEFNRPQAIEWDPARGELLIADSCNHRVGRFTPGGDLLSWTEGGDLPLRYPYGIELLEDGTALVVEFEGHRVRWLDLGSGETLGVYGEPGFGEGQMHSPWAIAAIGREAFVLDSRNNRVLAFRSPARAVADGGTP